MTQKLNILVVDDEASVAASIVWALKPFGPTKVVTDGEQALAKLAANSMIDLLITDHSMPGMSGLELVGRLRETGYDGKVLVLSAHLSHGNRAAYDSLGVNAMLPKPFDINALRKTIDELFKDPATL